MSEHSLPPSEEFAHESNPAPDGTSSGADAMSAATPRAAEAAVAPAEDAALLEDASPSSTVAAVSEPAPEPPREAEAAADASEGDGESFSQLLEARPPADPHTLAPGQRVRGKILSIGDEQVIVSLSGRPDAVLPTHELRGPDGTMLLRLDDPVSAIVEKVDVPVVLTLGKKRGLLNLSKLRQAMEEKRPVSGTVRGVNKGGFEVRVQGLRGFCPLSQMDFGTALDPQSYVGHTYAFRVLRWENGGRNIVLSRRSILKEESVTKAAETRTKLAVDAEFDGIVKRIQPFGAFVDIGGIEGLLHVSRMGRGHVSDPTQVLQPGQAIRVRVTRIDDVGTGKERIALAAADLGPDPWETARETLVEGAVVQGRVARLADFGVFVNVAPGIDGLVHISEIVRAESAAGAVETPPLQPGETIEVRVVRVDLEKKRVSLSMRLTPPPPRAPMREGREARDGREGRDGRDAREGREGRRPRRDRDRDRERDTRDREMPGAGSGGSLTHTMAEQLGALRRKLQVRP